ncbi:MAG TPA: hypothetical protein VFR37_23830 [Longimicrobium sp.]|nr:hypothetical protein [Longimicrobium sp.]
MSTARTIVPAAETQAPTQRAEPEPLPITVEDAWLQPRPKPVDAAGFGYLHAERGEPVSCSWLELIDACRAGQALLAWTPETAEMVAPQQVPQLAAAILKEGVLDARSRRFRILVVLTLMAALLLLLPPGWVFLPLAALIAWSANARVRQAEARTEDDIAWPVPGAGPSSPALPAPSPYTLAMGTATAAAGAAQIALLGQEWLEGMWIPERPDTWLDLLGAPMLHEEPLMMFLHCMVLGGLGMTLEKEAPRAYLPLSFVAGALAGIGAELLLPGSLPTGPLAGLMGMAGFYAMLAARQAGDRPALDWLTSPATLVSGSAVILAYLFALAPLGGAGLLAGLVLGWLCIPRRGELVQEDASAGEVWAEWLGRGALGLIWLSALAAIASLLIG